MKYLKLYFLTLKMNIMDMAINRGNFVVWVLVHTSSFVVNIIFFEIIYSQIKSINGWNYYQALIVLGVSSIIIGLGSGTFFPFFWGFARQIRHGDFDMKLVKPVDIQFQSAFYWIDLEDVVQLPLGIILIIYCLQYLVFLPGLLNIFIFVVLIINTMVILFSLASLILSMAFKFVRVDASVHFFWSIVNVSHYPAKAIKTGSIIVTALLVPLALFTSVPAEVIFGRIEWQWITGSLALGILLFFISRWVFLRSVRNYTSASS